MIIYNRYFKIEFIKDDVYYNMNKIYYKNHVELYEILNKYIKRKKTDKIYLDGEFEPLNNNQQVILLVLANYYKSLFSTKYSKEIDITFSYNFPIFEQKWIINRILKIGTKAFSTNMISLGDSNHYIEKNTSNNNEYKEFYKKYGYIIRRGDSLFDIKTNNLSLTLDYWNNYCIKKHNKRFTKEALEVYEDIYSTLGFNSIKLIYKDELVACAVYFRDYINKKMYFCIMGWNEKYKKFSPGIYLYCKGIQFCNKENYNFSFCYGLQKYKQDLLNSFGG